MKSNVKKIMEEKEVTIRELMARIDDLFPRSKKSGEKQATAMATVVKARTDPDPTREKDPYGIEGCTLLTLKMIARALGVRVCDLYEEEPNAEQPPSDCPK